MILLVGLCSAVLHILSLWFLSEKSRGLLLWLLSKIGYFLTTLAAIAVGTILTTHFCSLVLPNQQSTDSFWKTIFFALHVLETRDSSNSECMNAAFAASLATSLGWNIFCYERWDFNVIAQLIMGTSFGVNAGIAVGKVDMPSSCCIAIVAATIVIVSLQILDLTFYLFMKWITKKVMNGTKKYIWGNIRNFCRQTGESVMSRARSVYAFLFEERQVQPQEAQIDDDFPTFDVVTILAFIGSTLFGGFVGNGHVVTYVPFFNIELVYTGWKSFVLSAVAAVATIIGMRIPLFSTWTPLRSLVGVFVGISLGTNAGVIIGQLQMEIMVFIAFCVALAVITVRILLRRAICFYLKSRRRKRRPHNN